MPTSKHWEGSFGRTEAPPMTDTASLVSRLRQLREDRGRIYDVAGDDVDVALGDSIDTIERLREFAEHVASWPIPLPLSTGDAVGQRQALRKRARAALKDTQT